MYFVALVRAVLHVRALFEKMRALVDQIARYYIVLQYSRMSQPPWSNFRGGWRPRRPPWFLRLCATTISDSEQGSYTAGEDGHGTAGNDNQQTSAQTDESTTRRVQTRSQQK